MDGIFNISELPVLIAEALPGEIPVPLQLLQGGSDRIHTVLTDMGEPLCGIIRRLPALNIQEMICDGTKQ